jgi:hypothetical protein
MSKKVKGFNVDEDTYKSLIAIFKKYNVNASLSAYVNDRLKGLLTSLQEIERGLRDYEKFTVPMSFIINSILTAKDEIEYEREALEGVSKDDMKEGILFTELRDWQNDYESQRRKIPVPFLEFLSSGLYELSPDKKYLIEKKTGKKYIAGKTRNTIFEVKSEG